MDQGKLKPVWGLKRGYEQSPTCSREWLYFVFSIAATMSWELQSIDVTSAF